MSESVKLYEFTCVATFSTVIAATSEEDAKEYIASWERSWLNESNADFVGVSDVDLFDVRPLAVMVHVDDQSHAVTSSALDAMEATND